MSRAKFPALIVMLLIFAVPALVSAQNGTAGNQESQPTPNPSTKENEDQKFEGTVVLRVTFLATGEVGEVELVSGLSDELNRQAVASARKIKFDPARKDGVAVPVTKKVEYTFFRSYEENDPDLRANAEITRQPAPAYPNGKKFAGTKGKVRVTLDLRAGGKVEITKIESDLPQEFKDRARKAALKIKFKPAVAKNGRNVSQSKEIEYEFNPEND